MPLPKGVRIRERRVELGITTAELAARVGFTNEGSNSLTTRARRIAWSTAIERERNREQA